MLGCTVSVAHVPLSRQNGCATFIDMRDAPITDSASAQQAASLCGGLVGTASSGLLLRHFRAKVSQ